MSVLKESIIYIPLAHGLLAGDSMDSGTEEDEFALLLEIQYQGACSVMAVVYTNPNELNVGEIKRQAMEHFELYSQSSIWLVYNGRKLQDNELVKSIQGNT